jgi:hypothetical protein
MVQFYYFFNNIEKIHILISAFVSEVKKAGNIQGTNEKILAPIVESREHNI